MTPDDADILSAVRAGFQGLPPQRLGVAVSGGGDSVALLHALTRCFEPGTVALEAATVDHGLRPEAAEEAAEVARLADTLGIPHAVLRWSDRNENGNLQDQARRARFRLLAEWARTRDIAMVALGHTADDQAETVLMRLARAAGTDGLAAMRPSRVQHGITFLRPLLRLTREDLRAYLMRNGLAWADDPTNADERYDRIKARNALPALEPLGITAPVLAEVAENMARARDALNWYTFLAAKEMAEVSGGAVAFDLRRLRTLPEEIARRLVIHAIHWIAGGDYPPRRAPVAAMVEAARTGYGSTLGGCRLISRRGLAWICREYDAVARLSSAPDTVWDGRWRLTCPDAGSGTEVAALGPDGLAQCPDWRNSGLPRPVLLASPALWRDGELLSAPLAGLANGCSAELECGADAFHAAILSH